jgi:hypothetical protein
MPRLVLVIAALALASGGPALAQGGFNPGKKPGGYGTFSPGGPTPAPNSDFGLSKAPAPRTSPMTPPSTMAPAPAFKPYEPWKPNATTSLFGPGGKPKKK